MKERKRIAVDMDNVMADITSQLSDWYYRRTGIWVGEEQMLGHSETTVFPDPAMARGFLYEPGFFYELKVLPDAQEVLAEMNKHHDIYIVSAAMEFPNSLIEKYRWLEKHFPFLGWQQFVLCGSKEIIKADWLIDDHLKNLDYFDGEKLLFYAPHNVGITKYRRVNNWKEVAEIFL
jgi:5'(3')-deoxyribonucleotidase